MFHVNINQHLLHNVVPVQDIELLTPEQQLRSRFEKADLGSRVDIIHHLWRQPSASLAAACDGPDISQNILTGLKLYDMIGCNGQAELVSAKLNDTALLVFIDAAQGRIRLDNLDAKMKARLFAMACRCIELPENESGRRFVEHRHHYLQNLLSIPQELDLVIDDNTVIEYALIDIAVDLLAAAHENFQSTTTLFYNPEKGQTALVVAQYLQELAEVSIDNALRKLALLNPGQKLMIPVMSSPFDHNTRKACDGHFSAVLAVKTDKGYHFSIFDSKSDPGESDNINLVIGYIMQFLASMKGLNRIPDYQISDYRQFFQSNADCGIHTYNFFKLCVETPDKVFDDGNSNKAITNNFENYILHHNYAKLALKEDIDAAGKLLRIKFMLDCIKNGYVANMLLDEQIHSRLYTRIVPDGIVPGEQTSKGGPRFDMRKLTRRLTHLFS